MVTTHILGFPRIGEHRELKFALERYWRGEISQQELESAGQTIRRHNWTKQKESGLGYVTVGDFAWYDHVLNTSLLLGHIPARHRSQTLSLDTLFSIARGKEGSGCGCSNRAASDMTKWFNTNYHYIVPEFSQDDKFEVSWTQLFDEIQEAQSLGHQVKPVLIGPLTYLYLGNETDKSFDKKALLPALVDAYRVILERIKQLGVDWVQIDEPILALELDESWLDLFKPTYESLSGSVKLLLATYFSGVGHVLETIGELKVDGLHLDLVTAPQQLSDALATLPASWIISLGVINGRNVWKADLDKWLSVLTPVLNDFSEREFWIGSSCSLLHSPVDLTLEKTLSVETGSWFAFAYQKLEEVRLLSEALDGNEKAQKACEEYSIPVRQRQKNVRVNKKEVAERIAGLTAANSVRKLDYSDRVSYQQEELKLPLLPTTTIGSFPQTDDIRKTRSAFRQGRLAENEYKTAIQQEIARTIREQEALDLDVLVHGEAERNDMVEYFAENLSGFQTTKFGWVQSYGSRCVKPAIVVEDVTRPAPMTVEWSQYAQSLTKRPVKGMLTGPVTILGWTFPREDVSRETVALQIALALKDEVDDLQKAGIGIIQIDEPALREGLPIKQTEHQAYLDWAVRAFRLSAASAWPETQIHTHMCYSEFNEIIESVSALDADVITIETSRSNMALLDAFREFRYPNEIGPGVYDIHSPNVPDVEWMTSLLRKAAKLIPHQRLWVNPDCGLKTRGWTETRAALKNMVAAARVLRKELA
ncbi:5-methyltetrahydropteroyltriglutamate--homocysteine S-methyltransferase [Vibrio salinus]|uniref:5-methyltetrahydropteroyltriglutamate-- homocysteine S-methyltransferase n=1 Tax=Vibrio salinus TaxID=2899784 RepID=UPI001E2FC318|nr:5-methyltetrahydropteroyltriglutamate--homocysteine S-methyltransferase [Vibrio salinus]MCE0492718.1 5-methyltetrahydropteroyltriglutamate--homocysteine S-methyltransferase [Vibrio salinus]